MNKTYLLGVGAVVAIAVVAGLALTSTKEEPENGAESMTERMSEKMSGKMSMKHSLKDFLGMGDTLKCTYSSTDENATTEGITYVANGKVRSDSTTTPTKTGTAMSSYSIIDGEYMYSWGSEMPEGMKMKLDAMTEMGNMTKPETGADAQPPKEVVAYDEALDYDCEAWSVDASLFVPPSNITFTDYSEMMKGMGDMMKGAGMGTDAGMMDGEMMPEAHTMGGTGSMGGSAGNNAMMCAACEQAPDAESKAQCKAALGCS